MASILSRKVRRRAQDKCEYCRIPQICFPFPFGMDHIIARQHGGTSDLQNLAWACLHCNAHKGPNISGIDPVTKRMVRLFNPRRQRWQRHFKWQETLVNGRTAIGRTTVLVLNMNDDYFVSLRAELIDENLFPFD